MGTRGLYGFRKNGIDKTTYNHYDSYPDYLGAMIVKFCKETSIEEMNEIFDRIVLVDEDSKPTKQQIAECMDYYDSDVSKQTPEDWYCLLREAQGAPDAYKNGLKYMIDNHDFIKNSLFCEYAYIIDLDTNILEFYVGFQTVPTILNRYGTEKDGNYYPCKMVSFYPIDPECMSKYSVQDYVDDMNKKSGE